MQIICEVPHWPLLDRTLLHFVASAWEAGQPPAQAEEDCCLLRPRYRHAPILLRKSLPQLFPQFLPRSFSTTFNLQVILDSQATSQKAFPPNLIIIMKFLLLLLLSIQVLLALPSLDPYQVLGLPPRASRQQIRRAFKDLSLQYHPDINPNEQKRYQTIIEAYETLKKTSNQEEAESVDFQGSPSYVDLEDLLNRIELQMRQESSLKLNESFIPWCIRNPRIILAVLLISTGLVFVCK